MDLTPLYDLRDRLKAGAVAGTGLIGEDFRLTRALEGLAPLEKAAPVFAKIGQGVRVLLDPACDDKAVALLDALSLCDAVLVTQGAVNVSGELEALPLKNVGSALTNAPYSVLSPLIEALTTSGGGRYSFVLETHDQQPELFADYRVKNALVAALGASYNELAVQAEIWLSADGPSILPLLTNGFDPKGKKEMVRRIHVIEAVSGAASNDFYLSLLESAEKEVRGAAVYALRHDEANAERLVTLAKTEKGPAKKQAHWALARLESPLAWAYWEELAAKKPDQAADYMALSTTPQASALVAQGLLSLLAPYEADPKAEIPKDLAGKLQRLLQALPGKSGPEICDMYRRAAALGEALDRPAVEEKGPMQLQCANSQEAVTLSRVIPSILTRSLYFHWTADLGALAEELHQTYGLRYAAPHLMTALLTQSAAEAFQVGKTVLSPPVSIFKKKEQKEYHTALEETLGLLAWSQETHRQTMRMPFYDPATDRTEYLPRPLAEDLDMGWYDQMISKCDTFGVFLFRMAQPENDAIRTRLGGHLYAMGKLIQNNLPYLDTLRTLHWETCEGLAVRYYENNNKIYPWSLGNYFCRLPGSNAEKAEEAERLLKLAEAGKIGFTNNGSANGMVQLRQLILDLRNAAPIAL